MKKIILILFVLISSVSLFAQNAPEGIIDDFFKEYIKNPSKAVDDMFATNPWMVRVADAIGNIKKEVNSYTVEDYGIFYGYELITKKQLTGSFILYSYLIKYDRQPLRFIFKVYKPNDKWEIYGFNIDSELSEEIETSAKIYNLNLEKE